MAQVYSSKGVLSVPIKNCVCVFLCYSPIGLMNASPIDYWSLAIQGSISQVSNPKVVAVVPCVYTRSLDGIIGDLILLLE